MTWTQAASTPGYTTTAEGLNFILEPTSWSIWDLSQAQATAEHLANLKASGQTGWANGSEVRLYYREEV